MKNWHLLQSQWVSHQMRLLSVLPHIDSAGCFCGLEMNEDVINVICFQSLLAIISPHDQRRGNLEVGLRFRGQDGWTPGLFRTPSLFQSCLGNSQRWGIYFQQWAEPSRARRRERSLKGLFPKSWRTTVSDETQCLTSWGELISWRRAESLFSGGRRHRGRG